MALLRKYFSRLALGIVVSNFL